MRESSKLLLSAFVGGAVGLLIGYEFCYILLKETYISNQNKIERLMEDNRKSNISNYEYFKTINFIDSVVNDNKCCSLRVYNARIEYYNYSGINN